MSKVVGIDVGDKMSAVCVLDRDSGEMSEFDVGTTPAEMKRAFGSLSPSVIALEVGTHSPWLDRLLTSFGHDVILANARRLKLIYGDVRKNDRSDAEKLAKLADYDRALLSPIKHRSKETQADLAVIRAREVHVAQRTMAINHVRGAVKSFGQRLPGCSSACFAKKMAELIPAELADALMPQLENIARLSEEIRDYDRKIEALCSKHDATEILRQIGGVGPLTALTFVLTLEDPNRFRKSRDVGPYLGLCSKQSQSGDRDPELRISKSGDRLLRTQLVRAAQYILGRFGPDTDLRRWGLALAARGRKNAKKRAVVATARKLSVLLHRLWRDQTNYEPLRRNGAKGTAA